MFLLRYYEIINILMNQLKNEFRIAVNDIMVSYTDDGKSGAPSLIFIHGFPFIKSMWNHQVEVLKNKYHVITYDIRGHGNSDNGNENFSIEKFSFPLSELPCP